MEPNQFDNNNHQPSPFIDNAKQGQFVNNPGTNNYIQVKRSTIKYQKKGLNPKAAAKNRRIIGILIAIILDIVVFVLAFGQGLAREILDSESQFFWFYVFLFLYPFVGYLISRIFISSAPVGITSLATIVLGIYAIVTQVFMSSTGMNGAENVFTKIVLFFIIVGIMCASNGICLKLSEKAKRFDDSV